MIICASPTKKTICKRLSWQWSTLGACLKIHVGAVSSNCRTSTHKGLMMSALRPYRNRQRFSSTFRSTTKKFMCLTLARPIRGRGRLFRSKCVVSCERGFIKYWKGLRGLFPQYTTNLSPLLLFNSYWLNTGYRLPPRVWREIIATQTLLWKCLRLYKSFNCFGFYHLSQKGQCKRWYFYLKKITCD